MENTRERILDAILILEDLWVLAKIRDDKERESISVTMEYLKTRSNVTKKEIYQHQTRRTSEEFRNRKRIDESHKLPSQQKEPVNESKVANIYNMEIIEMLADKHGVNEVIFIDQPLHTVNGYTYQVMTIPNLETIFEEANGGDVYLLQYNVNRGFAVKPEEGCGI